MFEAPTEHRHFVAVASIALDGSEVTKQPGVQAERVEVAGRDLVSLEVGRGVNGMFDMVAVHGENRHRSQFGKSAEQVLQIIAGAAHQLSIELAEQVSAAVGMKAVEEGRAGQVLLENLPGLLEEIPATGGLAQDPADAEPQETKIVEGPLPVNVADVVIEDMIGGTEQLLEQARVIRGVEWEAGS